MTALIWFREFDLRLFDHAPVHHALLKKGDVACVFVWDDDVENPYRSLGAASKWWLHHSLTSLQKDIESRGGKLIILRGKTDTVLKNLVGELQVREIFFHKGYDPRSQFIEKNVERSIKGCLFHGFEGQILFTPNTIMTKEGKPFSVFTPFWKCCMTQLDEVLHSTLYPLPIAFPLSDKTRSIPSLPLLSLSLYDGPIDWAKDFSSHWAVGEKNAHQRLNDFIERSLRHYHEKRDYPVEDATSKMSPHLRFGEISARTIFKKIKRVVALDATLARGAECFLREIGWREFSYHLLHRYPDLATKPLRPVFEKMPWEDNPSFLASWKKGKTGYPIVDAGMRQLWKTGWMHNRVRMIVASFLIKDLFIDWRVGESWFWDTLVDADPASNPASWQWVAGCGADAAPYFRIFNPMLQSQKFDETGHYIRTFVPELHALTPSSIHDPWKSALPQSFIYPRPVVKHDLCRKKALKIYESLK